MAATNRYYKKVGTWYLLATAALAIVFPIAVDSELSYFTIFAVVLLSGMAQVVNFFFQGKYRILMQVEGKNYILTNLGTIVNVCTSISKIVEKTRYKAFILWPRYLVIILGICAPPLRVPIMPLK